MVPRSTYRESRPSPPLDPWIACFWSQTIARGAEDFLQRVLPDDCIDIIWFGSGSPRVVGPATIPFVERVSPGTTITGVRFRPGAGAAALNVAATELRNLQLELAAVVGSATARQFEAPELLERTLRNYLVKRPPPDPLATALVTALERRLADPVHTVVAAAGISDRHARRRSVTPLVTDSRRSSASRDSRACVPGQPSLIDAPSPRSHAILGMPIRRT